MSLLAQGRPWGRPSQPLRDLSLGLRLRGRAGGLAARFLRGPLSDSDILSPPLAHGYGGKFLRLNLVPAVIQERKGQLCTCCGESTPVPEGGGVPRPPDTLQGTKTMA